MCIRIEFEFIDQEHFSRMCIRICYKVNSCEKREVHVSNSIVLIIFHVPLHTHKKITELTLKQFRFGNSSTQITEHNSQNNSVRDSVILCSHSSRDHKQFQKQFGSVITEQELTKIIQK